MDKQETTPIFHAGILEFNIGKVGGSELGENYAELMQVLFI